MAENSAQPRILFASDAIDWESLEDDSSDNNSLDEESEPTHQDITMSFFGLMGQPYEFQDFNKTHLALARMLSIVPDGDPSASLIYEIFGNLCASHAQRVQDADNHIFSTPIRIEARNDPETIYDLGMAHKDQFIRGGELDNLERAIGCMIKAVELTPETDPRLPKYLFGLSGTLLEKFERFSEDQVLEDAIEHQRRGVSLLEPTSTEPDCLADLGYLLMRRFQVKGNVTDLDEAIRLQESTVASAIKDTEKAAICYNSLGMSLVLRFENTSDPLDLERAINLYERTLEQDLATAVKATTNHNLGSALQKIMRFT
ncbi:hypothetical protein BN14_05996 [Rhizoctonia solani AG-1 IB]|uniref:Uncharacterized protein n=1 Tax=Thanatephorus cucumeris (strain AG1-IB / isolate 7/3/14) TaxID=1108050 RepID=M5BXF6_THACB|nr:hypothetical protein BN14_05996 [Rhizoctonia solani AG-1 IB]